VLVSCRLSSTGTGFLSILFPPEDSALLTVGLPDRLRWRPGLCRGLLTNADMDSHSPFACLPVGQPTLRRRIKLGTFAALDQRIALRYAMTGMRDTETKSYLSHHLALAGRSDTLFSDDATALIHQVSRGIPRAVNNLAVQALVAAFATSKAIVDESSARAAVTEVTTD